MAQTQEREASAGAPERAEELLTRAGAQLGHWAGGALRRLQQTAQAFRDEADRLDLPDEERQTAQSQTSQEEQPARERAEVVVDRLLQRMSLWTMQGNVAMRRSVARLREDVEDMWVEAQERQRDWQHRAGRSEENAR
jgi:hypothetical protein